MANYQGTGFCESHQYLNKAEILNPGLEVACSTLNLSQKDLIKAQKYPSSRTKDNNEFIFSSDKVTNNSSHIPELAFPIKIFGLLNGE